MYGIFTYIWLISMIHVGNYTMHASYGSNQQPNTPSLKHASHGASSANHTL